MVDIIIRTVPRAEQRYDTCGDWMFRKTGSLQVRVSELGDWRMEALVAVHEIIEALLCKARGISEESVTEFDKNHALALEIDRCPCEAVGGCDARRFGHCNLGVEPGDHPDAPYRREHFFATSVERLLCAELGVDWARYETAIGALYETGALR